MKLQKLKKGAIFFFSLTLLASQSFAQDIPNLRFFMQEGSNPNSIAYGNNASAGRYIQSGDARIYFEVYGKGKPIVVLHGGIVGSMLEMGRFIDSLSTTHQVIAISTRGHGKSEMGSVVPSYEQKSKDVLAVTESVTQEKVTVLGFSDGAYTGYFFAGNFPEKIDQLIAIGAGEWKDGFRTFTMTSESAIAMDEAYWKQQLALRPEPQRIDEWFETVGDYYNALSVGKAVFEEIKCPVLVLAGEKDQNAPLNTVIDAYRMIPNSKLSIIPNVGHAVFLENFEAVWFSMLPFLQK